MAKNRYLTSFLICITILGSLVPNYLYSQVLQLNNSCYTVYYNPDLRIPVFCDWSVSCNTCSSNNRADGGSFKIDSRCPVPRATPRDYTNSEYQRGHMCPSADMAYNKRAMKETFLMSNIVPQLPRLNMGDMKRSEMQCRKLIQVHHRCSVRIWAMFLPIDTVRIGKHSVAVPHFFYKEAYSTNPDTIWQRWFLFNF